MSRAARKTSPELSGGVVTVSLTRDRTDGSPRWVVLFTSRSAFWQSVPFEDVAHAEAGAVVLSSFAGARLAL